MLIIFVVHDDGAAQTTQIYAVDARFNHFLTIWCVVSATATHHMKFI